MAEPVCFVINLSANSARMASIAGGLEAAGMHYERIEAVDGRNMPATAFAAYDRAVGRRLYGRKISGAEAACFLSHRAATAAFLASDADAALILEDDAVIPANFSVFVKELIAWLHAEFAGRWDVVNLGRAASGPFTPLPCKLDAQNDAVLGVCHAFPLTTLGLIWSREGAQTFLAQTARIYAPVDQFLCDLYATNSRGLGFKCAPLRASSAPSDINYRLWQRILDTRDLGALITKQRRLNRNARLAIESESRFLQGFPY